MLLLLLLIVVVVLSHHPTVQIDAGSSPPLSLSRFRMVGSGAFTRAVVVVVVVVVIAASSSSSRIGSRCRCRWWCWCDIDDISMARRGVLHTVKKIGSHFEGLHHESAPGIGGHETRGNGRLAHTGMRTRNHQSRNHNNIWYGGCCGCRCRCRRR
jgi:hypothetical protein